MIPPWAGDGAPALHTAVGTHIVSFSGSQRSVFRSRWHPGPTSFEWAFTQALASPMAACSLPIMIAALLAALQGYPILPFLTIGFPLAIVTALLWTAFRLALLPAELHVRRYTVAYRTVWDTLRHDTPRRWQRVLDLRLMQGRLTVALDDETLELRRSDWPSFDALLGRLQHARDMTRERHLSRQP